MAGKANVEVMEIRPIKTRQVTIRIVGDTPLIMHAWSEKAKRMMLDTQMGKSKGRKKESKNPIEDFIRSAYWLTPMPENMTEEGFNKAIADGAKFGFPVTAIKQAAISAAYRLGWSKDKASLRPAFFIEGDANGMVEIHSDAPIMREDMVRVGNGSADIRYRAEFRNWYADLVITFNENGNYDLETICNIINAGGYACGIGEWRPERDGSYGMFHVATK